MNRYTWLIAPLWGVVAGSCELPHMTDARAAICGTAAALIGLLAFRQFYLWGHDD
jgi:hypothetical protein